ncbi:hypothetical protein SMICM17S_06540 [Streptomyces microflavus]
MRGAFQRTSGATFTTNTEITAFTLPTEARPGTAGSFIAAATFNVGFSTKAAYAAWQRKLGYTGSAADGIPGRASLEKLGVKRGFKVKA